MDGLPDSIETKPEMMMLDSLADFHADLEKQKKFTVDLSRRVTALEGGHAHDSDNPLESMMPMVWIMVFLTVAPLVVDLVVKWRSSQS